MPRRWEDEERRAGPWPPLAQAMERLADHRNALAHAYLDLSPHETWHWLRDGLPAMAEFAQQGILASR